MDLLLCYNETTTKLIELLRQDINIYNSDIKDKINNYIYFLSNQDENNSSYACKTCLFQKNIYDIINNDSVVDMCKKYDIDILSEYNKYIVRTPEDNNALIDLIGELDLFNQMNKTLNNETEKTKKPIKYLKKYKIIRSNKNNEENLKGGGIGEGIANFIINYSKIITKFTINIMSASFKDFKKGTTQSLIIFGKSTLNINESSLIKIIKKGPVVLEKKLIKDPAYIYKNVFCEANTITSLTLNLIINNFITFLARMLIIIKKSGSFVINFRNYSASDIIYTTFFSIMIPLFIVLFAFQTPFVSLFNTHVVDSKFMNYFEETINVILAGLLINLVLLPLYIKIGKLSKFHDPTITRFIVDSSTMSLTQNISEMTNVLFSSNLKNVGFNMGFAFLEKFKIDTFLKNLLKNPEIINETKNIQLLAFNIMRINMDTITIYDLEKRQQIIHAIRENKQLVETLIENGFNLDNFYKNMSNVI